MASNLPVRDGTFSPTVFEELNSANSMSKSLEAGPPLVEF